MQNFANIAFVDTHAKSNSCGNGLQLVAKEAVVDAAACVVGKTFLVTTE